MTKLHFEIAGLFISNGKGRHVTRTCPNNELIFVKSGTLHIREADRRFEVKAGQYLILHKDIEHGGTANYEKDLSFFWAHFTCPEKMLKDLPSFGTSLRRDYFTQYFTLLVNEQKTPDNQRTCDLLMEILLNEAGRNGIRKDVSQYDLSELAESAKRIIDLRFSDNISANDVAVELNCSRDYLSKIFRKATGRTVLQYINFLRCRQAAMLLASNSHSVKEIAFFCGFNDLPHFRKLFYRQYSVTPGEYRRINRISKVNTMYL